MSAAARCRAVLGWARLLARRTKGARPTHRRMRRVSPICQRGYFIVHGQVAFVGNSAKELGNHEWIRKIYLGAADGK